MPNYKGWGRRPPYVHVLAQSQKILLTNGCGSRIFYQILVSSTDRSNGKEWKLMKGARKPQKVLEDFSRKQWQTEEERKREIGRKKQCRQCEEGTEVLPLRIAEV